MAGLVQEGVQGGAVALEGGDHVGEGLGARGEVPAQQHAQDSQRSSQLLAQALLLHPLQHPLPHHLVPHLSPKTLVNRTICNSPRQCVAIPGRPALEVPLGSFSPHAPTIHTSSIDNSEPFMASRVVMLS